MRNFTLTLYAKRKGDGTYDYSLKVWENRSTGSLATMTSFESGSLIAQRFDAVLPVGADANFSGPEANNSGEYWFPFTMPMSVEQAANLGWCSDSPFDHCLLN